MQLLTMQRIAQTAPGFKPASPSQGHPRLFTPMYRRPDQGKPAPRLWAAPVPRPEDPTLPRDIASRFGRRIRELRQARCMTQVEVAVHFGIDRTFISDVERGRKSVCLPTLEVFALGFGLSLSDLLRGI